MPFVELTLLHHGRSLADDERKVEGSYDSPLTDIGRKQARALAAYWAANPPGFDRGESEAAFRARALLALAEVWEGGGERILVVSHGGMLNAIVAALTGARSTTFRFADTAFATLHVARDRDLVRIHGVNQTPHLA